MVSRRVLRSRGERFALVVAHAVQPGEPRVSITAHAATALLTPLFAHPLDAVDLRRIAADLSPGGPTRDDREVLAQVVAALVTGRVALLRVDPPRARTHNAPQPRSDRQGQDDFDQSKPPVDDTHWVEIQLVDEGGGGVPDQRYLVISSDGRKFRGYTDPLGSARIRRLPPGNCQVSFPDLDASAWAQITSDESP